MKQAPWDVLAAMWDLSVMLDVPRDLLRARLVARWDAHGLDPAAAAERAEGNDLANADLIKAQSCDADLVF